MGCNNQQQDKGAVAPSSTAIQATTNNSNNSFTQEQSPGNIASVFPKSDYDESIIIDSVSDNQAIRAEQQTDRGTLLLISNGKEERGHLNISSTAGQEGDQTFQSNYSIIYRQEDQDKVLLELPAFLFIQPTDKILTFKKLSFKDADVYLLTPQYTTGHGLEAYVFAIDKQSGNAFPLEIVLKNKFAAKILVYSEVEAPSIENDVLVVHPAVGAGTSEENSKDVFYKLDLSKRQLVAE